MITPLGEYCFEILSALIFRMVDIDEGSTDPTASNPNLSFYLAAHVFSAYSEIASWIPQMRLAAEP